jgi:hypothetical protein
MPFLGYPLRREVLSTLDATIREAHRKSCTTLHGGQVVHNRGRGWNLQADDSDELEKPTWA